MNRIICISAGQLQTKKVDSTITRRHQYLNYGLLSLATVLSKNGFDPVVLHGHFNSPASLLLEAEALGLDQRNSSPVLISLPSFYAVGWAAQFMLLCKTRFPLVRFIVGGRWVVGDTPERLKLLLPLADRVIKGLAEWQIVELVGGRQQTQSILPSTSQPNSSFLDYRLLHKRELYQPSIEVSRGCGMGCSFCQERSERLQPLKCPTKVINELSNTLLSDELTPMTAYFEASMFVPTQTWVAAFEQEVNQKSLELNWRTEGRVDNIKPELIPQLAAAGMRVLDLGLESASPEQLLRMKKTKQPHGYLERASRLLEACAANGIKVKVNLLLFAGETDETVATTLDWLDARKEQFYGVSVGPVIAYGWPEEVRGYLDELTSYGATFSHAPCYGVNHLDLSPDMPHDRALAVSRELSKRYMTAENYYWLKSFSYFSRDYSYHDFLTDVAKTSSPLSFETSHLSLRAEHGQHFSELDT